MLSIIYRKGLVLQQTFHIYNFESNIHQNTLNTSTKDQLSAVSISNFHLVHYTRDLSHQFTTPITASASLPRLIEFRKSLKIQRLNDVFEYPPPGTRLKQKSTIIPQRRTLDLDNRGKVRVRVRFRTTQRAEERSGPFANGNLARLKENALLKIEVGADQFLPSFTAIFHVRAELGFVFKSVVSVKSFFRMNVASSYCWSFSEIASFQFVETSHVFAVCFSGANEVVSFCILLERRY